jgi:hypothetical protein
MPQVQDTVETLAFAMSDEIACFEAYVAAQRGFSAALRGREWPALQASMLELDALSSQLGERESVRAEAFEQLRAELGCDAGGMYRVALLVDEPMRTRLTDLYRQLKLSAMRAKFENASAGDYASGNRDLLKAVLDELFPEKKAHIYGRSGKKIQNGLDSVILNSAY